MRLTYMLQVAADMDHQQAELTLSKAMVQIRQMKFLCKSIGSVRTQYVFLKYKREFRKRFICRSA